MSGRFPEIIYTEEGMREGMQIEDANIPIDAKVALLEALSETGLKRIVVGSFVSPRYTPQMARIDELMQKFHPQAGVTYTALALNEQVVERAKKYSPPLTIERSSRSRTGPRPTSVKALYDMNAPFVETLEQATHFKRGPEVYAGAIYPWKEPIASPYRDRVEQGLPPFEVDGDWPWNEEFFPKPSAIHGTDQP